MSSCFLIVDVLPPGHGRVVGVEFVVRLPVGSDVIVGCLIAGLMRSPDPACRVEPP